MSNNANSNLYAVFNMPSDINCDNALLSISFPQNINSSSIYIKSKIHKNYTLIQECGANVLCDSYNKCLNHYELGEDYNNTASISILLINTYSNNYQCPSFGASKSINITLDCNAYLALTTTVVYSTKYDRIVEPNQKSATTSNVLIYDKNILDAKSYDIHFAVVGMDCIYPQLTVRYKPSNTFSVYVYGSNQFIDSCSYTTPSYENESDCNETFNCMVGEHISYIISNGSIYHIRLNSFKDHDNTFCSFYFSANITLQCEALDTDYIYTTSLPYIRPTQIRIEPSNYTSYLTIIPMIAMGLIFMCCVLTISCYYYPKTQKSAIPKQSKSKLVMTTPLCIICGISQYKNDYVHNIMNDIEIISILCKSRGFDIFYLESSFVKTIDFWRFIEQTKKKINDINGRYDGLIVFLVGLGNNDKIWPSDINFNDEIKPNHCIQISSMKEKLQYLDIPKLIFVQTYLYNRAGNNDDHKSKDESDDDDDEKGEEEKYLLSNESTMNNDELNNNKSINFKGSNKQKQKHIDSDFLVSHNKTKISNLADGNGVFFQSLFSMLDKYTLLDKSIHLILQDVQQIDANNCVVSSTLFSNKSLYLSRQQTNFDNLFHEYHQEIIENKEKELISVILLIDVELSDTNSDSLITIKILEYMNELQYYLAEHHIIANFAAISSYNYIEKITTILNYIFDNYSDTMILLFLCGYMTNMNQQTLMNKLRSYESVKTFTHYLISSNLMIEDPVDEPEHDENETIVKFHIVQNQQKKRRKVCSWCRTCCVCCLPIVIFIASCLFWRLVPGPWDARNLAVPIGFSLLCCCYVWPLQVAYCQAPKSSWNYCECNRCVFMICGISCKCGKCAPWLVVGCPVVSSLLLVWIILGLDNLVIWLIYGIPVLIYGCWCGSIILVCQRCRYCKYHAVTTRVNTKKHSKTYEIKELHIKEAVQPYTSIEMS